MWREAARNLFILMAVGAMLAPLALAAELHVGPGQTYVTIQAAVDAAVTDDLVSVHAGTYVENVVLDKRITLRSYEFAHHNDNTAVVIDATFLGDEHGIEVLVGGTTVRGFSVFGAMGYTPSVHHRAGIRVFNADNCVIEHNRCGWDGDHRNNVGLMSVRSNGGRIAGNELAEGAYGLWLEDAIDTDILGNHIHSNYYITNSAGILAHHNTYPSCHLNVFRGNLVENNSIGIHLLGGFEANGISGNEISRNYYGLMANGYSSYNMIDNNTFVDNTLAGIALNSSDGNTVVDNYLDNNHNGMWLGSTGSSDRGGKNNMILRNTIINHAYAGLRISVASTGNRMFLNTFAGNLTNVISYGTEWSTPSPVAYWHGENWSGPLGNYYDTYTGTDLDGDGIGDTDLPFDDGDPTTGPSEMYPLVDPPDRYRLQAWYMDGATPPVMHQRDLTTSGQLDMAGGTSVVWISDEPARNAMTFAAAAWTGQVSFNSSPAYDTFLLEVGTSTGGGDFTPSGAQATVGGAMEAAFATTAVAVGVPDGHHLALRLTNTTVYEYSVVTGGVTTWLSSPGSDDPLWPSGWTSDVPDAAAGPSVRLAQNHPNPFNPITLIAFELDTPSTVSLRVYDVSGRLVRTLLHSAPFGRGAHRAPWTGRDDQGRQVAAGVYYYRLEAAGRSLTRPMVLVK